MKHLIDAFAFRLKLRYKLFVSFFIIIIPLILLDSYIYFRFSKELLSQAVNSATQMFNQTQTSLENLIDRYDVLAFSLSNLQELTDDYTWDDANVNQLIARRRELEKSIYSILVTTENSGVKVYTPHSTGLYNGQNYLSFEDAQGQIWFENLMEGFHSDMTPFIICPVDSLPENNIPSPNPSKRFERHIAFARVVKNPDDYRECLGVVRVDLDERHITRILDQNYLYRNYAAYVETADGQLIIAESTSSLAELADYLPEISDTDGEWIPVAVNGDRWLMRKESIGKYNAILVNIIPEEEIFQSVASIQRTAIALFIAVATITVFFALMIAHSIDRRTQHLKAKMLTVKQGCPQHIHRDMGQDEIGQLASSYNYMVDEMEKLMQTAYRNGQDLKNAELRVLQAQINPHFLYNTLDMISFFASQNRAEETQQAISALVNFYRITLSKGQDMLTLRDELRHIHYYLILSNLRYDNRIRYVQDVPEALMDHHIIKTTLQPIVENAIIHGIMCKPEKTGVITLTARLDALGLRICVSDDGVGIPARQLAHILDVPSGGASPNSRDVSAGSAMDSTASSGYGVANVHARLRIFYGKPYGLSYQSEPGKGTQVSILINPSIRQPISTVVN